jgi:ABC-type multidrug transport system fused ATPase/permease subunit
MQNFTDMKKTNLVVLALIITLAISSCSQRYSYLSRVKADSPKQEIVKRSTIRVNEIASKTFNINVQASKDLTASIETNNTVLSANAHLEEVAKIYSQIKESAKGRKTNKSIVKKINKINAIVNEKISKLSNKLDKQDTHKKQLEIDGVNWMIAGLILILAGAILAFVLGGLGVTIGGIGGLVFLIGLIFFLLDYLK